MYRADTLNPAIVKPLTPAQGRFSTLKKIKEKAEDTLKAEHARKIKGKSL